jgi:hypothetical protein
MHLQVLEVNRDKDLAFALAEYNRVRKPDMDALRYLDTISGRIWGGAHPALIPDMTRLTHQPSASTEAAVRSAARVQHLPSICTRELQLGISTTQCASPLSLSICQFCAAVPSFLSAAHTYCCCAERAVRAEHPLVAWC